MYRYITDGAGVAEMIEALLAEAGPRPLMAIDTETYPIGNIRTPYDFHDPYTWHVRLVQLRSRTGHPWIVDVKALKDAGDAEGLELLKAFLAMPEITWLGFNVKYEVKMIYGTLGVWLQTVYDLQAAVYLIGYATGINAFKERGMGLRPCVRDFLGIHLDKTEQSSHWGGTLTLSQLGYAAEDVVHLHALFDIFHTALVEEYHCPQTEALEMEVIPWVAEIEYNGIGFDKPLFEFIQLCAERHLPKLAEKLGDYFKLPMIEKLSDVTLEFERIPAFNWKSNAQVLELFNANGITCDDLEYETIKALSETHEILKTYTEFKSITKQLQTPLGDWVHPITKRIHGELLTWGAATGRFSAKDPNLQQIPKVDIEIPTDLVHLCPGGAARFLDKKKSKEKGYDVYLVNYRYCFVPEAGNDFFSSDYASQELGIMAVYSMDEGMIEVLNKPQYLLNEDGSPKLNDKGEPVENPEADLHSINCERAFGIPKERSREKHPEVPGKTYRDLSKGVSFGVPYGQSDAGFARTWNKPKTFAKKVVDSIKAAMPKLDVALKRAAAFGKHTMLSIFGLDRVRFLNDSVHTDRGAIERAAGNTPIQGTGAQMIKKAICYLGPVFRRLRAMGHNVYLMYPVHDEILAEGPKAMREHLKHVIVTEMNRSSHVFLKGVVPDRAGCTVGDHWTK